MKRYYIVACILLFLAIASDIIGKHYYSNGMCILAKAVSQGSTAYEAAKHESDTAGMIGTYFNAAGLLLALGGVVAWLRSMLMGNRERQYLTSVPPFNHALLSASLKQTGPWKGQHIVTDNAWCIEQLHAAIEALDWQQAREDVRRFVKPAELPSLELWSRDYFLNQCQKLS